VDNERELRFQALDVQTILEEMEFADNRMNIVILDACRNNPFERRIRGGSRGLAAIDAARGILIAYATAPGAVAADGDGDNGLYTAELLTALAVPNLKAEEVFKRVRVGVARRTNGAQVPWESSSLTGDFVFNQRGTATAATAPVLSSGHEALFWETIKDSENSDDYRAYLQQFPQGTFASLAVIRLSALEENSRRADSRASAEPEVTAAIGSASATATTAVSPARSSDKLRAALLPFNGWHRGGNAQTVLNNMERGIKYVVRNDSRLKLVYAYDHDGDHDPRIGDAERYWEGSIVDKKPKHEEVLADG
jgi:uncharacterized caspase-like protein